MTDALHSLQTDLRLTMEAGRVDAQGAVDLAKLRAPPSGLAVRIRQLDLAKLMRDTPVTAIDLDLNTRGEHLDADLRASAPGAAVNGHGALDEGRVEARARIEATDLAADGPEPGALPPGAAHRSGGPGADRRGALRTARSPVAARRWPRSPADRSSTIPSAV